MADFDWQGILAGLEDQVQERVAGSMAEALVGEIRPLVDGAAEDVQAFGLAVARDYLRVFMTGDDAAKHQLRGQVAILAQKQKIRLQLIEWDVVERVLVIAAKVAASLLKIPLP
jgi:hypothetical protein